MCIVLLSVDSMLSYLKLYPLKPHLSLGAGVGVGVGAGAGVGSIVGQL